MDTTISAAARFEFRTRVGKGPAGERYLARDRQTGLLVTVTLVNARFAGDDGYRARLREEAGRAATLRHRAIAQVFEGGYGVAPFLVGDGLRGTSLADLLAREGALDPERATRIAAEASTGLAYAHARGVVHAGLAPSEIVLDADDGVQLHGFAAAAAVRPFVGLSVAELLGTTAYAAPEQARDGRRDARSDVYALGACLHEMVTGQPPAAADAAANGDASAAAPARLRALRPDLPPWLAAIILTALQQDPADRFANAEAMGAALRDAGDALALEPVAQAPGPAPAAPAPEPARPPTPAPERSARSTVRPGPATRVRAKRPKRQQPAPPKPPPAPEPPARPAPEPPPPAPVAATPPPAAQPAPKPKARAAARPRPGGRARPKRSRAPLPASPVLARESRARRRKRLAAALGTAAVVAAAVAVLVPALGGSGGDPPSAQVGGPAAVAPAVAGVSTDAIDSLVAIIDGDPAAIGLGADELKAQLEVIDGLEGDDRRAAMNDAYGLTRHLVRASQVDLGFAERAAAVLGGPYRLKVLLPGEPFAARRAIEIPWEPDPRAAYYRVDLVTDGETMVSEITQGPQYTLPALAPGRYRMEVRSGLGDLDEERYAADVWLTTLLRLED